MQTPNTVGSRIANARNHMGYNQSQLARLINVSPKFVIPASSHHFSSDAIIFLHQYLTREFSWF